MTLVDSLLTAMERANGDALVMHVGERPYVIAQSRTIDVSAHALGVGAMHGMLTRLLPGEARAMLDKVGAVEHALPARGPNRFTVVAARGGEDIWIEIRRRQAPPVNAIVVDVEPVAADPEPEAVSEPAAESASDAVAGTAPEPEIESVAEAAEPEIIPEAVPETVEASAEAGADEATPQEEPAPAETETDAVAADSADESIGEGAFAEAGTVPEADAVADAAEEPLPSAAESSQPLEEVYVLDTATLAEGEAAARPEMPAAVAAVSGSGGQDLPPPVDSPPIDPMPESQPPVSLTRTVRIEVPHMMTTTAQRLPGVARLIRLGAAAGATELFLTPQSPPYMRVGGNVRQIDEEPPLTAAEIDAFAGEIAPDTLRTDVREGRSIEWLADIAEVGRVRCASFSDKRGVGLICRIVQARVASIDELDLGEAVMNLATEPDGLVVIAGPDGSGKSTIVSAFVDAINRRRADYVITIESDVRLVHENRHALISQREVEADAESRLNAARGALREDPDVLVIEGLDSADLVELALDATARGVLVIATTPAGSATEAVAGLVELVEPGRRAAVSARLAECFRGAVSQLLLRKIGGGRLAAREVILASGDVSRAFADPSLANLESAVESGRTFGMTRLADALVGHVKSGAVDVREAYRRSHDRERFASALADAGVDTALIDRLR